MFVYSPHSFSAVHLPFHCITSFTSLHAFHTHYCTSIEPRPALSFPIIQGAVNFPLFLSPLPFIPLHLSLLNSQLSLSYSRFSLLLISSLPLSAKSFCLLRAQLWIILLITSLSFIQQELVMIVSKNLHS